MKHAPSFARRAARVLCATVLAVAAMAASTAALAFPDKPVRIVVGFAPGGSDVSARLIAPKLQELWGQPVIIDNKPGAAGNLGADAVARSAPDGYTMLLFVNSYTINTSVFKGLSWDAVRDFAPVGRYGRSPMVVVVNSSVPVKDLKGLVALAKSKPGALNYGSAGVATSPHLAVEWFAAGTGIEATHVPYRGSAPSVLGLVGNEVQFSFGALSAFEPMIKDGRLRALAVTTAQRNVALPELPTVAEEVMPGFDADIWYGFVVPAATPPAVVQKLSKDLQTVLADADLQSKLRGRGVEPAYLDPRATAELIRKDVARWREVAERIKLKLD